MEDAFGEPGINMVSGRRAGGRVLILDYLLLVKLDAPRRFREYLRVRWRCFLTNQNPFAPPL